MGVGGQSHTSVARERPGTPFTGGWVGPKAGLDGRKISSPSGFDPGSSRNTILMLRNSCNEICMYICYYKTSNFVGLQILVIAPWGWRPTVGTRKREYSIIIAYIRFEWMFCCIIRNCRRMSTIGVGGWRFKTKRRQPKPLFSSVPPVSCLN